MRIAENNIATALAPLKFEMQSGLNDITFVRSSKVGGLYERIECVYVGNTGNTIALSVALSVVRCTALQFRGLFERGGWPEMCTDPDNGRVTLHSKEEIGNWLRQLAEDAPERLERLARQRGATLLSATRQARDRTAVVGNLMLGPGLADALREPLGNLTEDQTSSIEELMRLPFVVSSEELRQVYAVAIAAMVRAGDDLIAGVVSAPAPLGKIARLRAVPNELIWRIRLLVDRILMLRDAAPR